jgi:hypothetical protein
LFELSWPGGTNYSLCILYNQRDATYTTFFIIISALHVSGGFSANHQELIKLYVQPCHCHAFLLCTAGVDGLDSTHISGRQQEIMTIPKAAHTVL